MISLIENGECNSCINIESLQRIARELHPEKSLTGLIGMAENIPAIDEVIHRAKELLLELRA